MRNELGALVPAGVALAVLLLGCGPQPQPSLRDLETTDAGQLRFPGATVVFSGPQVEQGRPAYVEILLTDATVPEVVDWYDDELRKLGFDGEAGIWGIRWSDEVYACGWHSGSEVARLSFMRYGRASATFDEILEYPDAGHTVVIWAVIDSSRTFSPRPCGTIRDALHSGSPE